MPKLTTAEFIERARAKHADKYDYSKSVYRAAKEPVTIICPEHGEFSQTPDGHYRAGCARCSGRGAVTTEEFIQRARQRHGDRYDYSKAVCKSAKDPITIICPVNGEFSQQPDKHYLHGCRQCGIENRAKVRIAKAAQRILDRFKAVHGDRYDYSEFVYAGVHKPCTIICREHGPYVTTPAIHYRPRHCPACSNLERVDGPEIVRRSIARQGDHYDYSYVAPDAKSESKIKIICPEHGAFYQRAIEHYGPKGKGCNRCADIKRGLANRSLTEEALIERFRETHGDYYNYSKVKVSYDHRNVTIVCPEHGEFVQDNSAHAKGSGCPSCASHGFDMGAAARLYYLRIETENGPLYKIGITNNTVYRRFKAHRKDLNRITILKRWQFEKGAKARARENEIKSDHKPHRYRGPKILINWGNTELFTKDVLGLDPQSPESPHPILQEILQDAVEIPVDQED